MTPDEKDKELRKGLAQGAYKGPIPSPEIRAEAIHNALKGSKLSYLTSLTDQQKSDAILKSATSRIWDLCSAVIKADVDQSGTFNEESAGKLVYDMYMSFTNTENKESLRHMLSIVLTSIMVEKLKELQYYLDSQDGNPNS